MSLDVAALIRASAGGLDRSASTGCLHNAGPDGGAGVGANEAYVAKDPTSDLSDSGGEDDIQRQVMGVFHT